MKHRVLVLTALTVAILGCATLVRAQQPLRLQIAGGRVTLHAQGVPLRTILTEWARLGGAKILNGDRVAGAPITLDLENVPERQALDILLRGVSGYLLAAREPGGAGASMYDRIMILPTSAAPRNPAPAATPGQPIFPNAPGFVRPIGPPLPPNDQNDDDTPNGIDDGVPGARPVQLQRPPTSIDGMPIPPTGLPPIGPRQDGPETAQPGVVSTPANPFGMPPGSSTTPGVIAPAPPPAQPPARNGPADQLVR